MDLNIELRQEGKRGCGYRKPGGLYLVSVGIPRACGKLPVPCDRCPCCGGGIKPTRGWSWVDADALLLQHACAFEAAGQGCGGCPLHGSVGRAGLLWVGESFYPTPEDWTREAGKMGVSRRIPHLPKGLELGKTWVLMAHRKCIKTRCLCVVPGEALEGDHADPECKRCDGTGTMYLPGIFHAFQPTAAEYVCRDVEDTEKLEAMVKRGITLVKVENPGRAVDEAPELFEEEEVTGG